MIIHTARFMSSIEFRDISALFEFPKFLTIFEKIVDMFVFSFFLKLDIKHKLPLQSLIIQYQCRFALSEFFTSSATFHFNLFVQVFLFALIVIAAASPSPQLFPSGLSPLLAQYSPAPEAPANTVHASHVAALSPAITYSYTPYPYSYVSLNHHSIK